MDLQKIIERKHRYSPQSVEILKNVENLDLDELEKFVEKEFFVIGGSYILAYFEWLSRMERISTEKKLPIKVIKQKFLNEK